MHAFRTATCGAVASRVGALGKTPFADFASAGHKDVLKGVLFEIHHFNISIIAIRQAANKSGAHI